MSLNEMELCLINHIGPMPKYDAESIEKASMLVSLAGTAAFTRKVFKKTNKLSFFIRFDDVKEYILSNILGQFGIYLLQPVADVLSFGLAVIVVRKIKFANDKCKKDGI